MDNPTSLRQKLLLILFGLFSSLLLVEGLLRLSALIAHKVMLQSVKVVNNADTIILCIGDSSTWGLGASKPDKFSYPSQLQALLNQKIKKPKFHVLNIGLPGLNSSQVLNRFSNNLSQYKPHIVVMNIGVNDAWNLEENTYLRQYNEIGFFPRLILEYRRFLSKLRLYRFFKLIYASSMKKHWLGQSSQMEGPAAAPRSNDEAMIIPQFNDEVRSNAAVIGNRSPSAVYYTIEANISELQRIAEEHRVLVIFMNYHIAASWGDTAKIVNDVYAKLGVPFVNQLSIFDKAQELGMPVRSEDNWHPSDLGYLLMAKGIFNRLVDLQIVDTGAIEIYPSSLYVGNSR